MNLTIEPVMNIRGAALLLKGELDVYTSPKLKAALIDLIDEDHQHIVVDLRAVDFFDNSALGALLVALKRIRSKDGTLSLVATTDPILRSLNITGLIKVFPVYCSVEEALSVERVAE